ncbi:MAG: transglycosylase SLT domain-containing protein [Gammaproteobacteria bacterium]
MRQIISVIIVGFWLLAAAASSEPVDPWKEDRALFLKAYKALNEHRYREFNQLAKQLRDYPLYPYLEFWEMRGDLLHVSNEDIAAFIERYQGDSVSARMRQSWLYQLARQRDWKKLLQEYRGNQPVTLQCYKLQAQINTGQTDGLVDDALKLWMIGKSQVKNCDPVFKYLDDHKAITEDLLWQRIRLAMQQGNPGLALFLAKKLPDEDRVWVELWRDARNRPAKTLAAPKLKKDSPQAREIILYSVRRIASSDADLAFEKWARLKPRYAFSDAEIGELEKNMALSAAWQRNPRAHEWLEAVPQAAVDDKLREWRIRTAVSIGDWPAVVKHTADLSVEETRREEWRYWRALALENTGQRTQALEDFAQLARERDYHGFLAADFMNWPYEMGNQPIEYDPVILEALSQKPEFIRARELYRAELFIDARREWAYITRGMSPDNLKLAAVLAEQWGWHDRAILTVAQSKDYSDLNLRFPIDYQKEVRKIAQQYKLEPAHVYAVIRQESAFNKDARSHAGALGLMQLMPRTGKVTAKKNNIPLPSTGLLYEPDKNITIGSAYLKQVMAQFDDNIVLASAAYNAGPHRVKRWLPEDEEKPAARWIAMVPFNETRNYIQRILAYIAIYDWRLEQPATPIRKHMPDILPTDAYKAYDR